MRSTKEAVEALARMFDDAQHSKDLPTNDPLYDLAKKLGTAFTNHVDFLRTEVPNPDIQHFGTMLWRIIGNQIVPVSIGPDVDTVSFLGYQHAGKVRAQLILPKHWEKMCCDDPLLQMGAVVFNGSKVIDTYNDRFDNGLVERSFAWEAEFYRTLARDAPGVKFNSYQKQVLERYPDGIRSEGIRKAMYTWRPFAPPT